MSGLRDLALIAAMFYRFARVSAVLKLKVDDYYHNGARRRLRLHEKGGKEHDMPVHHLLEQMLNEYIEAAGLQSGQPLFQSVNSAGMEVTGRALNRYNAWAAIRKRAKAAGFPSDVTRGAQPASRFIWSTTDGSSTPSRWPAMSLREPPSYMTDKGRDYTQRSGADPAVRFDFYIYCFAATTTRTLVNQIPAIVSDTRLRPREFAQIAAA